MIWLHSSSKLVQLQNQDGLIHQTSWECSLTHKNSQTAPKNPRIVWESITWPRLQWGVVVSIFAGQWIAPLCHFIYLNMDITPVHLNFCPWRVLLCPQFYLQNLTEGRDHNSQVYPKPKEMERETCSPNYFWVCLREEFTPRGEAQVDV